MSKIDLGKDKILPTLLKLALPSMIGQIVNMLYNLIDRIYVGNIQNGTQALAGLGVCFPITLILSSFASLVGLGGTPLSSIKLGENKKDEANKIFNQSFIFLIIIGFSLTIITFIFAKDILSLFGCPSDSLDYGTSYLKIYCIGTIFTLLTLGLNPFINAQGFALTSMFTTLIGASLNIILDPIFIYNLNLGINGAALATIISQIVSCIYVVTFFLKNKTLLSILFLGLSPFIMQITESAIQIVFSICLNKTTNGNSDYTACMTILLSALQFISYPLNGFSNGAQPLISFNYGAKNKQRLTIAIKYIAIFSFIYTSIFYSISMIYPKLYGYIFSSTEQVQTLIEQYGRIFLMGTIMFFAQMSLQNVFVALNQAKISIFLACLRKVILLIPLCIILSSIIGAKGIFLSEGIADITAGIITFTTFCLYAPRVIKKKCD